MTANNKRVNKNNNFDFLRFVFAILVVVSHAYPLSGSSESAQWIYQITNGQIVYAKIGLDGFFIISGFFIFKSLQRSSSINNYLKKRFLRLFPGLFFVLLLTLIAVPFLYNSDIPFCSNKEFLTYLPNNFSLYGFQPLITGVFDNNPYHSINGSLWTLRYEFSLYVVLVLLYFFRDNKKLIRMLLLFAFSTLFLVHVIFFGGFMELTILGMKGNHILNFGAYFVAGSLLASFGFDRIKNRQQSFFIVSITIVALLILVSIYFNYYNYVKHIFFTIIVLLIGYMPIKILSDFRKIGDMSYGIYIYSFPIAQIMMYFFSLSTYELMVYSILVSIVFGFLSWHLIEKKVLRYKNVSNIK